MTSVRDIAKGRGMIASAGMTYLAKVGSSAHSVAGATGLGSPVASQGKHSSS